MSACFIHVFFVFKQNTAYEMRMSDWSSDVCSSDLAQAEFSLVDVDNALDDGQAQPRARGAWVGAAREAFERGVGQRGGNAWPGVGDGDAPAMLVQIGRASGREGVCQYV